jgi:hypothetical protein
MSKFFKVRHPFTVQVSGHPDHVFFARELGFLEFDELRTIIKSKMPDAPRNVFGRALLQAVVLASIEEQDGTLSYTEKDWVREIESVAAIVGKNAMKAQGYDVDAKQPAEPEVESEQSEEDAAKNP